MLRLSSLPFRVVSPTSFSACRYSGAAVSHTLISLLKIGRRAEMKQSNISKFFGSKAGRASTGKKLLRAAKSMTPPAVENPEPLPREPESPSKDSSIAADIAQQEAGLLTPKPASVPQPRKLNRLRKANAQEDGEGKVEEISGADANGGPSASTIAAAVRNAMMEAPQSQASEGSPPPASKASPKKRKRSSATQSPGSEADEDSEPEEKAKPKKKPVLKSKFPAKKVEGVGNGALAAAALYGNFDLDQTARWKNGDPVPFVYLAAAFEAIGSDSKRLVKTQQLVQFFRGILGRTPEDLLPAVYLCTNQVAPSHVGTELGIGDAILIKALAQATGRQEGKIKQEYSECGDLGSVASAARGMQRTMFKPKPLTLRGVFRLSVECRTFLEIAETQGNKSQERKRTLINKLLVASQDLEPGYIMRALQGKLRIGLGAETVLAALAHAVLLHRTEGGVKSETLANELERASQAVKLAYSQCPSYDQLIPALLQYPVEELHEHVHFLAGVPVKPMLAKPTTGVSEVLDKFQDTEFTCEYKYDGERAQIHVTQEGVVSIYSRNSENNTTKYPDLIAAMPGFLHEGVESVVLDCEAVAFDRETNKILPFQILSTRGRKDVKVEDIKVQVCIFAFDCLYLDGETLLQQPLTKRRAALQTAIKEEHGRMQIATAKTSTDLEELGKFLDESVVAGTEGLIVKTMDSTYEPSRRSAHWLKLKKDYLEGVGDTFDVVPIGAWHGKGKRKGVYGSYLLAVYDEASEEFQTISKIGTGFSEEQLIDLSTLLNTFTIPSPHSYYKYGETLEPDVWFDAKAVWEVKAADLSISPVHCAAHGLVDANKGISIRFPRLVRIRDDKDPEQATSAEQVADMYRAQAVHTSKNRAKEADED